METTGPFTIYFNRHQAVPLVWCIARPNWEIAVSKVFINAFCETRYDATKLTPDDEDGKPSAYLYIPFGTLSIDEQQSVAYVNN
jgi:hypothetical protein